MGHGLMFPNKNENTMDILSNETKFPTKTMETHCLMPRDVPRSSDADKVRLGGLGLLGDLVKFENTTFCRE